MYPHRLARLLPVVHWIGLDVKAPLDTYERVTGVPGSGRAVGRALQLLAGWTGGYEVRTTVDPRTLASHDVLRLAGQLAALGIRRYALQACRDDGHPLPIPWLEEVADQIRSWFDTLTIRS